MGSYPSNVKYSGGSHKPRQHSGSYKRNRQSPIGLFVIILVVGLLFYFWYSSLKGNIIFLQSVGATEITRGYDFGPIFLKRNVYYRSEIVLTVPDSTDWWTISTQLLNSNRQQLTSDIRMLAPGISPKVQKGKRWVESKVFKQSFIDSGFYFLNVKQTDGTSMLEQSSHPVVRILVKEDVGIPWVGYLILVLTFVISVLVLLRQSLSR